jgi:hypothetical protein
MTIQTSGKGQWTVPSQTTTDTIYLVRRVNGSLTCDCDGFYFRGHCKHVTAVAAKLNAERTTSKLSDEARAWGLAAITGKLA